MVSRVDRAGSPVRGDRSPRPAGRPPWRAGSGGSTPAVRRTVATVASAGLAVVVFLAAVRLFYDPARAATAAGVSVFVCLSASVLFGVGAAGVERDDTGELARAVLERLWMAALAVAPVAAVAAWWYDAPPAAAGTLVVAAVLALGWLAGSSVLLARTVRPGRRRRTGATLVFLAVLAAGAVLVPPLRQVPAVVEALGWLPPLPLRDLLVAGFAGPDASGLVDGDRGVAARVAVVLAWTVAGLGVAALVRPGGRSDRADGPPSGSPPRTGGGLAAGRPRNAGGAAMDVAVTVRGLRKRYGDREAVAGIDLTIARGEVFALLGPNGAGKTTTVEILEGQRQRTAGEVSVLGFDPWTGGRAFRERIGVVLQSAGLVLELTLRETVELYRGYYPNPRPADEVIELVGLTPQRDLRISRLSGGQLRRLDLALALVGDPEIIFLDEPTTGFDPQIRAQAWSTIQLLADQGRTILLTTHYLEEAARLADRVAVMVDGRIVATGSPTMLTALSEHSSVVRFALPDGVAPADLPAELGEVTVADGFVRATVSEPERVLHRLTGWALAEGHALRGLSVERPTLEDVYLRLIDAKEKVSGHELIGN